MVFYSKKMGVWNSFQMMWDLFQNQVLNAFHSFQNPSMHTHASIYVCMHKACGRRSVACMCIRVYAYACPRVFVAFLFQKQLIQFIKKLYFFEIPSSSQFQYDRALNQSQALEFQHHQGNGGSSRKGYKMRYLQLVLFIGYSFFLFFRYFNHCACGKSTH